MFVSPKIQIENIKKWNKKYKWGFTAKDFKSLPEPPQNPEEDLVAVVLVPYLKTVQKTFDALWKVIEDTQDTWRWDELKKVKLLVAKHAPGLRWVVLELGANKGLSPDKSRGKLAGVEILACGAQSPEWLKAMDGEEVPHVNLAALRSEYDGAWTDCPYVYRGVVSRQVGLLAYWAGSVNQGFSAPTVRESVPSSLESRTLEDFGSLNLELKELTINGKLFRRVDED